uniref:Uncharacterized protein n=1 Tax=Oryctolagus cuniculus TaxID=9986 RepID=A0A5F9DUS5_RABIT
MLRLSWSGFQGKRSVHVGEGESNTKAKALATKGLNPSQGCGLSTLELSWNTNPNPSPALREANNSENSCFLVTGLQGSLLSASRFTTLRGLQLCAPPEQPWVGRIIRRLKRISAKASLALPSPASCLQAPGPSFCP